MHTHNLHRLRSLVGDFIISRLAMAVIRHLDLINLMALNEDHLVPLLLGLDRGYNPCLYHNCTHAADVLHATFCLLLEQVLSTLNPTPSTLNPQPSTLHPQPSTLHPQPSTLNPTPSTLNPQPSTFNPKPSALNPQPSTLNPQPSTLGCLRGVVLVSAVCSAPHRTRNHCRLRV